MNNLSNKKYLIFVNEFFGEWDTAKGGYGFLARHILPKALNIPTSNLTVCLGRSHSLYKCETRCSTEGIKLLKLPKLRFLAAKIVNSYDVLITIEATVDYLFSLKNRLNKKILFWIQDPRPSEDWDIINSVTLAKEENYYNSKTYELVNYCYNQNLLYFATQANYLTQKAVKLYKLDPSISIPFLPNPIEAQPDYSSKENNIIFLGRLDSVKRGWLFCEIAKQLPNYNFYVLGSSSNDLERQNNAILDKYKNLPNLHFLGHLDGEEKARELRKAKILVNTSIHEALPISFLEAFAYGATVVSNQNPDNLVQTYGRYIGESTGNGWEDVQKFVTEITFLLSNDEIRSDLANKAKKYLIRYHSVENFRKQLNLILDAMQSSNI